MKISMKYITVFLAATALSACAGTIERLENVGKKPPVSEISNPTEVAGYKPVSWPTPVEPAAYSQQSGSLWAAGSRSFFKDQRAARVGDILTIVVDIDDEAGLTNSSSSSRTGTENLAAPKLFGLEDKLKAFIPGDQDLSSLLNVSGNNSVKGDGAIDRSEQIKLKIAAMVTQILPNGNMVVRGTQDVRVNFEVRQVSIEGVIRPQDISSDNTVLGEQIAEARVSYGGEGTISNVQQPRLGTQVIDILSPF
jgi:flagellar L-ring protein precursor FlgH